MSFNTAPDLKVLLDESGASPFHEEASACKISFVSLHVLGQLLQINGSLEVEPVLLEKAEFCAERSEYIFKLKAGTLFHNQRQADSKDLEFALLRGLFSKNRSFYNIYLGNIDGADAVEPGEYASGAVRGVRIIDDLTVAVKLKKPDPTFLQTLARPYFSLVARDALDDSYLAWKGTPVGAGPYRVIETSDGQGRIRIEKTSSQWVGPKTVDIFTLDTEDQYDLSLAPTDKMKNGKTLYAELPGSIQTLFLSRLNPLSSDRNFRKALVHAIDREAIAQVTPGSTPTWEMLPSRLSKNNAEAKTYDPNKARNFVAKLSKTLISQTWKIVAFNGPKEPAPLIVEIISQLQAIGLKFEYASSPEKFRSEKTATEVPIFISGRVTDFINPLNTMASFLPTGHDPFLTFESDEIIESVYQDAMESVTLESRMEKVQVLSRQLTEKIVCVPLLERRWPIYYDAKRISRVEVWGNLGLFRLQDVEFAKCEHAFC